MSYTGQTRRVLLTVLDWNVLEDIHVVCYVPPAVFKGVRFTQRSVSILNRGIMRSDRMHRWIKSVDGRNHPTGLPFYTGQSWDSESGTARGWAGNQSLCDPRTASRPQTTLARSSFCCLFPTDWLSRSRATTEDRFFSFSMSELWLRKYGLPWNQYQQGKLTNKEKGRGGAVPGQRRSRGDSGMCAAPVPAGGQQRQCWGLSCISQLWCAKKLGVFILCSQAFGICDDLA